jgi:hypothetical protein
VFDVFPAKVVIDRYGQPRQMINKCRARAVGNTLEVWTENAIYPHEPVIAFTADILDEIDNSVSPNLPVRKQHVTLAISNGVVAIQRDAGCGCGSRLRAIPHNHLQPISSIHAAIQANWPETAEV